MEVQSLQDKNIIHVSAWAKAFTQFRMPLIRELRKLCRRQLIYCPDDTTHVSRLRQEGFEIHFGSVNQAFGPGVIPQIWQLYRFLSRQAFDILIGHQPLGALVGITAAYLAGVPVKIYSTGGLKYVPENQSLANRLIWSGEKGVIQMSDGVFLVNREDEELFPPDSGMQKKIFYVGPRGGCGVDIAQFNPARRADLREEVREELRLPPETFVVGFVGRCVWEKGFVEMVRAAQLLRDQGWGADRLVFLILGAGEDLDAIKAYVAARLKPANFIFLGYKFNLDYYYSAFDAFILPSYREGFPIALLEAMAMGLPSLATCVRGSRELITHQENGLLLEPKNAAALAEQIKFLAANSDAAARLGAQAAASVAARYAESYLIPQTLKALAKIVEAKCR